MAGIRIFKILDFLIKYFKSNISLFKVAYTPNLTNTYFGYELNLFPQKLDKRLSLTTFVSHTTRVQEINIFQ